MVPETSLMLKISSLSKHLFYKHHILTWKLVLTLPPLGLIWDVKFINTPIVSDQNVRKQNIFEEGSDTSPNPSFISIAKEVLSVWIDHR